MAGSVSKVMLLDTIDSPADLRGLSYEELTTLASEIREFIVHAVAVTGGHLGSNLGVVELTLALHRVFQSPRDILLWDTGHQAYAHKIVTGRRDRFPTLRQGGGLSGYPSRAESAHDWVENSHASAILGWAHGMATAFHLEGETDRRVVAVIGDGSMTGGMAYEALNNIGHSGRRVLVVLNDNGRSYAPTVSRWVAGLTRLRLNPSYVKNRDRLQRVLRDLPLFGEHLERGVEGVRAAMREVIEPNEFFEALGVRYVGPIDGHDIAGLERTLRQAATFDEPILVHVLTQKGRGYQPAEDDDEKCLHDAPVFDPVTGPPPWVPVGYTEAFADAVLRAAERDERVVAITAAMPGPTGLLPMQARFPERVLDVGIAEQHAVTAAAGMAMGGLKPVVAVYSTFFTRAFDQANLDVGLHHVPVVFCLDRAGITGDDGPSHHGVLDLALLNSIPGMTIFAPSSVEEVDVMLTQALSLDGPSALRYPKGAARRVPADQVGSGLSGRLIREGADVCILAVGKMVESACAAADLLEQQGVEATVWDVRVVKPLDEAMVIHAAQHPLVVTAEDGIRRGGAGSAIADAIAGLSTTTAGGPPVLVLGVPDRYVAQAGPAQIHAELGLDAEGMAESICARLGLAEVNTVPPVAAVRR